MLVENIGLQGRELQAHTKVNVVTLGCAKNVVDSEVLLARLRRNGLLTTDSPEDADVIIINTCGFVEAAKQESIDTILQIARLKEEGRSKRLYVAGCLSQRYPTELREALPEVDKFFGVMEFDRMLAELTSPGDRAETRYDLNERVLTTPSHYTYLKISEGCDNPCSFCAIPLIRGRHVSKPLNAVLEEAQALAEKGVKELILIGQDTTYYGLDLYGDRRLPVLLEGLCELDGIEWIRLMYTYPAKFPMEILDLMLDNEKICRYIDLPLQHISDVVLRSMRRGVTQRETEALLRRIRQRVTDIAFRTTLIVGYPNETEREFRELLDFVREASFARLGVFTYSLEEGTVAESFGDPVPSQVKEERKAQVMELQKQISLEQNEELIGRRVKLLVDRTEGGFLVGRTERDAPEVDNEVFVENDRDDGEDVLKIGSFYDVKIVDAVEYDLFAVNESEEVELETDHT